MVRVERECIWLAVRRTRLCLQREAELEAVVEITQRSPCPWLGSQFMFSSSKQSQQGNLCAGVKLVRYIVNAAANDQYEVIKQRGSPTLPSVKELRIASDVQVLQHYILTWQVPSPHAGSLIRRVTLSRKQRILLFCGIFILNSGYQAHSSMHYCSSSQ